MRFLADMGVAGRIVDWLRSGSHGAVHIRDEGLHRPPDGEIFRKAAEEQAVLPPADAAQARTRLESGEVNGKIVPEVST